jgi:glucan phosphoethanolaminetransferase (alkaline phosphatase superfamily)
MIAKSKNTQNQLRSHKINQLLLAFIFALVISLAEVISCLLTKNMHNLIEIYLLTISCILIPVFLFRNHIKLYAKLFFPFIALVPISICCGIFYKLPLNFDILVIVYNTNFNEAFELIKSYLPYLIVFIIAYCFLYYYLITYLKNEVPYASALKTSIISMMVFLIITSFTTRGNAYVAQLKNNFIAPYPQSLIYAVIKLNKKILLLKNEENLVKDFKFNTKQIKPISDKQIQVLVIGESARVKNWQLFGYARENSPNLMKIDSEIIKFKNTTSSGYITALAVPLLLSRATADNFEIHYREKSIISAFKEVGFKTYWLSNQDDFDDIGLSAKEADEQTYLPSNYTFGSHVNFDMELIPFFQKIMKKNDQKVLIVLHTLGSHYNYAARYPDEYDKFKPSLKTVQVSPTDYSKKQIIINSYDNSILYTDAFISRIIELLKKQNAVSNLTYISDHGEDLFDDDRNLSQHIHDVPSEYVARVPFFIWTSKKYNSAFADKISSLKANSNQAISSANVFYTLLDMNGISYPNINITKSISSSVFKSGEQRILGGDSKVYSFKSLIYKPKNSTKAN